MCRGIVDTSSLRLVVPGRIKRELPQQFTVLGHHPDVETVHQHDDALALVGVSHADVMVSSQTSGIVLEVLPSTIL
jgi:hypothetical protein